MTPIKKCRFSDLVLLEQLRYIETGQAKVLSYAGIADMEQHPMPGFNYAIFLGKLSDRARRLIQGNALNGILQRPEKLFLRAGRIILLLAALLGGVAAINATGESSTLNIYLLLAVLLGFNFLSMLLWCIGILLGIQGLSAGVAAQLASWLPFQFGKSARDSTGMLVARAWWEICLSGRIGKWRISLLTHQFWLVYLLAGMAILILLMMAKQYDFVWGTTLLPGSSLPELTRLLAVPMEFVGLISPDSQQIAASRIGAVMQDSQTRNAWAAFLVGALTIYGLLPRLMLILLTFLMLKLSEHRYKLDLYLPYYVALRQRLVANDFVTSVVDKDPGIPADPVPFTPRNRNRHLPTEALVVGIELDGHAVWPEGVTCSENITDRASLFLVSEKIRKSKNSLVIGVAAHRLPDRGVQRMVRELTVLVSGQVWLILLHSNNIAPVAESRKLAWFRLAQACAIPAEHVVT